jgi:CRP-like cAMP-binding protein
MHHALTRIPLFRSLPASELKALAETCELRRFHRGQTIFEEGKPAALVWMIARGCVHLMKRTPQGASATIFAMTPSEPLCGISAFDRGTYAASAVAATDSQLIALPAERFAGLLDRHPAFAREVLLTCCERIRRMAEAISLAQAPVDQRIAYVLLRLAHSFGSTIPITHHELASMAGTRWETSIRTLSAMKRSGWVSSARGRITLLAPGKLRALLPSAVS